MSGAASGGRGGNAAENASSSSSASAQQQQPPQLRIARANKQYLYSEEGHEYLDCLNCSAHVGHAHPHVVSAGQTQMGRLTTAQGYVSEQTTNFVKLLASIMPHDLNVVYMCNSEAEANDLAIRIARKVSGNSNMVTMRDSYYGNLSATLDVSPAVFDTSPHIRRKPHVHVLEVPSKECGEEEEGGHILLDDFATEAEKTIIGATANGSGGIAGFLCDTMMVSSGIRLLSRRYFERLYKCVRENGGLCIADETSAGLGRRGSHMWSFQRVGVVPDLVTVGKALGNGHPIGAVICSKQIAKAMDGYYSTFGGNPVSCSMGTAVIRVLQNEKLISSAHNVGVILKGSISKLKDKYSHCIGDFRGEGLIWAIDIVSKSAAGKSGQDGHDEVAIMSERPDPALAKRLVCHVKSESKILLGVAGSLKSSILFTPPMCFTVDNVRRLCQALEDALNKVPTPPPPPPPSSAPPSSPTSTAASGGSVARNNEAKRSRPPDDDDDSMPGQTCSSSKIHKT